MEKTETRFRLRQDEKVVGFSKQINNSTFYSKNNSSWQGEKIDFNLRDIFIGSHDINRRAIFSEDIVEFKGNVDHKFGLITYDDLMDACLILTPDGEDLITKKGVAFLKENPYVWKSYRFIQPLM